MNTLCIRSPVAWSEFADLALRAKSAAFDTEYESRGYPNVLVVGFSMAFKLEGEWHIAYVPLNHKVSGERLAGQLTVDQVRPKLQAIIDTVPVLAGHNWQADLKIAHLMGLDTTSLEIEGRLFDTMIGSWLLYSDKAGGHGLKELSWRELKYKYPALIEQLAPDEVVEDRTKPPLKSGPNKGKYRTKKTGIKLISYAPIDPTVIYAGADARNTLRLAFRYRKKVREAKKDKVYFSLLMPDLFYLVDMEEQGMPVDRRWLKHFVKRLRREIHHDTQAVYAMRPGTHKGEEFNLGSSPQLNAVLFKECGIEPIGSPGKSGYYSTRKDVMKLYAAAGYPIAKAIADVGSKETILGMVVGWLKRMVKCPDGTWRLFASFNEHGTRTGRLSSSDPNLQNVPVRDKRFPVRMAFIAPPGCVLGDDDFSQIELKLLAHFSHDERMLRVFNEGGDLHSETAKIVARLQGKPLKIPKGLSMHDEGVYVKKHYEVKRTPAKNVNFSTVYGIGPRGLSMRYDIPADEAKDFLEAHERIFPGAHRWIRSIQKFARRNGYVYTLFKRRRYLPAAQLNPDSFDEPEAARRAFIERSKAERQAVNSKVQGSAADVILLAMRNIRRHFKDSGEWLKSIFPAAQVHDELVFYHHEDVADAQQKVIINLMVTAVKLIVPIEAEGHTGPNWKAAKEA